MPERARTSHAELRPADEARGRSAETPIRANSCTSGGAGDSTVDDHLACDELADLLVAVTELAQNLDTVLPQLRRAVVVVAGAAAQLVRQRHVHDLAFGRMIDPLEETDVPQVRVFHQRIERVI